MKRNRCLQARGAIPRAGFQRVVVTGMIGVVLEVEQYSPIGLLISNGEFVSFHGPDPTMVRVGANNTLENPSRN